MVRIWRGNLFLQLGTASVVLGPWHVVLRAFGRCYGLFYHAPSTYRSPYSFWVELDFGSIAVREFRVHATRP